MSTPGAVTAMCGPMFEALKIWSLVSVADTAITFGSAAGYCGGDFGPKLPAAATSTAPLALAAARCRPRPGSVGPAKLILMTRAFWSVAYLRPLTIPIVGASLLAPDTPKARNARIRAAG